MRTLTVLILVAAIANVASAALTMEIVEVDNTPGGDALLGYVTQDLVVTTDSYWLGSQLIVDLDEPGKIYQDPMGNTNPQSPNPAFFPHFPSLEFDTYVSSGVLGEWVSTGGAEDLGGPPEVIFDTDHISIEWWTSDTDDIGTFPVARVTLHDSADGTWSFLSPTFPAEGYFPVNGPVINGHMVPEPAMLALLGVGSLAFIRRRRLPSK